MKQILIVEDDAQIAKNLTRLLRGQRKPVKNLLLWKKERTSP